MGGFRLYRAASPFNASELPEVDGTQSFDIMYLAHINHAPIRLERHGHTDWRFLTVTFGPTAVPPASCTVVATTPNTDASNSGNAYFPQPDYYVVTAIDGSTLQESRPSSVGTATNDLGLKRNYNTISWPAVTNAVRYRVYKSHNQQDYGFIGQGAGTTFRDDNIGPDLSFGILQEQAPFTGTGNYPSTVAFFEQRTWWGRTLNNPNALFSSRSADYENLDISTPLRADDAITIRLVSQGVNQINQLVPLANLLAFASDGVIKITGSNDDYLSANPPPKQRPQPSRGSSRLEPLVIDTVALYKPKNTAEIRAIAYNFQSDGFTADNVAIFSPDFFEGFDIVSWCWAAEPLSCVIAVRSDGAILCLTWEHEQEVWGWTLWPLDGFAKSVCAVQESGESRVYAIIQRTIAGVTKLCRERLASARWQGVVNECHLDCSVTREYDVPTDTADRLWHLEGQVVSAFADGVVVEGLTVRNGKVTLAFQFSTIHVGLPFDAIAETLPLTFQQPGQGASQGRKQQAGQATIKLVRSRDVEVGVRLDRLRPLKPRYIQALPSSDDSLLTGDYSIDTDPKIDFEVTAFIRQRIAPMTVTGVFLDVEATG